MFAVFGLGPGEVIVLALVGLLLFGNRLPEMARSVGKGMKAFKQGMNGLEDDLSEGLR
jgi:sec-independent protein translocase protein TatA